MKVLFGRCNRKEAERTRSKNGLRRLLPPRCRRRSVVGRVPVPMFPHSNKKYVLVSWHPIGWWGPPDGKRRSFPRGLHPLQVVFPPLVSFSHRLRWGLNLRFWIPLSFPVLVRRRLLFGRRLPRQGVKTLLLLPFYGYRRPRFRLVLLLDRFGRVIPRFHLLVIRVKRQWRINFLSPRLPRRCRLLLVSCPIGLLGRGLLRRLLV